MGSRYPLLPWLCGFDKGIIYSDWPPLHVVSHTSCILRSRVAWPAAAADWYGHQPCSPMSRHCTCTHYSFIGLRSIRCTLTYNPYEVRNIDRKLVAAVQHVDQVLCEKIVIQKAACLLQQQRFEMQASLLCYFLHSKVNLTLQNIC